MLLNLVKSKHVLKNKTLSITYIGTSKFLKIDVLSTRFMFSLLMHHFFVCLTAQGFRAQEYILLHAFFVISE